MIAVGEEANNLEQVLINVADNMEQRTMRDLDLAVRMIEPLMLLVMGAIITFIMLALLMPVFQGSDALG
jgi:general secretion pathway protein F/type IV pilus assembly protein PilC